jgi:ppGpp synthetase/RelA/SpoT-type nucleotidyltranferase
MSDATPLDDVQWVRSNVHRFVQVQPRYEAFAKALHAVLEIATHELAPLAIVQTRPKSAPSFAEKIVRKRAEYKGDPLAEMTDLCGGRVIARTAADVLVMCKFMESHFDIDWPNSQDVSQRLRPTEFGYRSVHYIVSFKRGAFFGQRMNVQVPEEVYGLKGEVQVRTLLEHAWADISHDLTYKSAFVVPQRLQREFARLAAVLEGTDREFARLLTELRAYASNYGRYLTPQQAQSEIEKLRLVLELDPQNAALAVRLANLAMNLGQWDTAIAALSRFEQAGSLAALRDLGIALCRKHHAAPGDADFLRGRDLLEKAAVEKDPESLRALADAWCHEDEEQARRHYRAAYEQDPSHPECLLSHLGYEIACQHHDAAIPLMTPAIEAAITRCRQQVEAQINLPWAFLHMGLLQLLLRRPYEAMASLAKAIQLCATPFVLDTGVRSLARFAPIRDRLTGYEWARRLLLVAQVARSRESQPAGAPLPQHLRRRLEEVASRCDEGGKLAPINTPLLIIAGGCDSSVQAKMESYRTILVEAFRDFRGTIISGGTIQGIAGLAGDVRQVYPGRIRCIGYAPGYVASTATVDTDRNRYDEVRRTEGSGFSPLEPLAGWMDMALSGINPRQVRLLGINGGQIAATEFRIALALGATVAIIEDSGREAGRILSDGDWCDSPGLLRLFADPMTLRAFVGSGAAVSLEPQLREAREGIAQQLHQEHRREVIQRGESELKAEDPSLNDWSELPESLRQSTFAQVDHIVAKLREIGCDIRSLPAGGKSDFQFMTAEVEKLAEMEHGRFNAERLLAGWRWGPEKDVSRKISPYLVSWQRLPEGVREWDRSAVRRIPELLAKVDLGVVRVV